jgi:hypothetical protein
MPAKPYVDSTQPFVRDRTEALYGLVIELVVQNFVRRFAYKSGWFTWNDSHCRIDRLFHTQSLMRSAKQIA